MDAQELLNQLTDPGAYPNAPDHIDIIQTHGALVCLAGDLVYKVKKPVDLGFFDFSTLAKRRHYCEEEVRLNQPLASGVYLGVVPIARTNGALRIEGDGEPVEYAVKMRRLPADRMLAALIDADNADASTMDRIAARLVRFHASARRDPDINAHADPDAIRKRLLTNLDQCAPFAGPAIDLALDQGPAIADSALDAIRAHAERFIDDHRDLLRQRVRDGHVIEGHGDVHAGNICIAPGFAPGFAPGIAPGIANDDVIIYDRIEFSEAFRSGDRAADAAFLAMDLSVRAQRDLREAFATAYARHAHDDHLPELLRLYVPHYACVRGKVDAIRASEPEISADDRRSARLRALRYFALATFEARAPFLIVTTGLPASGKSTVAHAAAQLSGAAWIRTDEVRKQLHNAAPTDRLPDSAYDEASTERTYAEALRRAEDSLTQGIPAILDGAFPSESMRARALDLARRLALPACIAHIHIDDDAARERLRARAARNDDPSDADEAVYETMRTRYESPDPDAAHVAAIDGAAPADLALARIAGALHQNPPKNQP